MILTLVLLSLTKNLRINTELERAYLENVKESYNLRGACFIALQKLPGKMDGTHDAVPSPKETGPEGVSEKERRKDYWRPRHEPYSLELGGRRYDVFIEDEQGRLNINFLDEDNREIFKRLLEVRGVTKGEAEVITDSLLDWLDEDDFPEPKGAESKFYESLPEPYTNRNGPLESLEELTLVKGVSPGVYERIEEDLTVSGKELKININSASSGVVHAVLGIKPKEAGKLVAFVKEKGGIKNIDELKDIFFRFGVAGMDFEEASALMTTTNSPYISIRSQGSTMRQYRLLVDKKRGEIVAVYPE